MTRAEREAEREARREETRTRRAEFKARQRKRKEKALRDAASVSIHVRHVPVGLEANELRRIFAPFGEVSRVKLLYPNGAAPSALLAMESADAANAVAAAVEGRTLPGANGAARVSLYRAAAGPAARRTKEAREDAEEDDSRGASSEGDSEASDGAPSSRASRRKAARTPPPPPPAPLDPGSVAADFDLDAKRLAAFAAASAIAEKKLASDPERRARERLRMRALEVNAAAARKLRGAKFRATPDRVDAHGDSFDAPSLRPRASGSSRRAVAGPGVAESSPSESHHWLSEEARRDLAAARSQRGGRRTTTAGRLLEDFSGGRLRRGGQGGKQGGQARETRGTSLPSSSRGAGRTPTRFGRGAGEMSRVDDRTQAALDARIREAREMASSDEPWEWDPAAFEHGAAKLFGENLDAAEYGAAPVVPGFQPRREYETEEALLARVRPFVSAYAGIEPEAFDSAARDALEDHAGFKARWLRARERRGESPVSGDFLAERKSLEAEVVSTRTR